MENVSPPDAAVNTPAPSGREIKRGLILDLASDCQADHPREQPITPSWWSEGAEELLRLHIAEGESTLAPYVIAAVLNLRGLDVDIVRMVRMLEAVSGDVAIRALVLCAIVVGLDLEDDSEMEATTSTALDILEAFEADDEGALDAITDAASARQAPADNLLVGLAIAAREGEVGPVPHWFAWDAALSQSLPCAQRWACTAVHDVLADALDALDPDRTREWGGRFEALGRFLVSGAVG